MTTAAAEYTEASSAALDSLFLICFKHTTNSCCTIKESTDDDKVVAWHWEEVKGPLREEKVSADTIVLTLKSLVPGNYTFRCRCASDDS